MIIKCIIFMECVWYISGSIIKIVIKSMQQDPLLIARKKVAIYSLQKSHYRIQKERLQIQQKDQTQIDNEVDDIIYSSLGFQSICSLYGDTSSVSKGKFGKSGQIYVTVGGSGEGIVWGNPGSLTDWNHVTDLKGVDKVCDVCIHPSIGSIPTFAPNIITGTNTGDILIWTFDSTLPHQKSIKIKAHSDRVSSLHFHQTGSIFLSSSYDKSWSIWDSSRVKQISNQKGHHRQIQTSSLHPDGSLYFTGDLAGDGMLWDLRTGQGVYEVSSNNTIVCSAFHPNGYQFVIGGKNNMIAVFDIRRKKQIKLIPAHLKLVSDLKFSEDGALLFSAGHDRIVKTWHGRSYCGVGSQLEHPSKVSSLDYYEGTLGVTMIDRKFTIWSNRNKKDNNGVDEVKMETQVK